MQMGAGGRKGNRPLPGPLPCPQPDLGSSVSERPREDHRQLELVYWESSSFLLLKAGVGVKWEAGALKQ